MYYATWLLVFHTVTNYSCHLFSIGFQANFGVADQLGYRKLIFLPCNCVVPEIWRWDSAARDKRNWEAAGWCSSRDRTKDLLAGIRLYCLGVVPSMTLQLGRLSTRSWFAILADNGDTWQLNAPSRSGDLAWHHVDRLFPNRWHGNMRKYRFALTR